MDLSEFFKSDYVNFASYDNVRKICSLVDGQKNASRKILYTILENNIVKEIKVSQLGSKVAEQTEYLHGSLDEVISGLGQDFAGTNNLPLLQKSGNFGTRFEHMASAPRYIYTHGSDVFFELFDKRDNSILESQHFEGSKIEPVFYVPALPVILCNGSEGLSSGFAQKILPRNPSEVKQYMLAKLNGLKTPELFPWYRGFSGKIAMGGKPNQWLIKGVAKKIGVNKVEITDIPPHYDLKKYINVLNDLEDKKVIQSYIDKSDDDNFHFIITVPSISLKAWSDDELLNKLKLIKTVTENLTTLDENNKIVVHTDIYALIEHYTRVKIKYIERRKLHLQEKMLESIKIDYSRYSFIKMIVDDKLVINKRKKSEIVEDLNAIDNIILVQNSYDYLLNMSIQSLTAERMEKLESSIRQQKIELDKLLKSTPTELWIDDIKGIKGIK